MKCPACERVLVTVNVGDIAVDVCQHGCGGMWFDRFELERVDEAHETAGAELLTIQRQPGVQTDPGERLRCPRCIGEKMMRHFHSVKRQVQVDQCPRCGGYWLDLGELAIIRTQFANEAERREATERFFDELFSDELAEMSEASEKEREAAAKVAHLFRFLCPSYYIPGKQGWGNY
jgi:Zn-finger nucleic acid-binding protein